MTTALTQRPQCFSRTIGSGSAPAIDGRLLDRALLHAPGLQDLAVRAVGDELLQRLLHGVAQLRVGLGEADAVWPALDRRAGHDLEELAVARGARDVDGAGQV